MNKNIRIGITHGDLNGIGYEIIMKSIADPRIFDGKTIIVYGSAKAAAFHRKNSEIENFNFHQINNADEAQQKRANIINCVDADIKVDAGKSTVEAGKASIEALQAAVADLKNNKIDVVVTAPINKKNITEAGFDFPGHTEFFAKEFGGSNHVMLLMNDLLKIGIVTGHMPLSEVPKHVTKENILSKLEVLHNTMMRDFAIRKPRIAVLGLNPHAGDNGVLGSEEQDIIIPAIAEAREKGIMALGPYAADGFFGAAEYKNFDMVLGMYHDQALAPFKALDFESAVNYTAGLPIIRVSPGHGTAYNIVGKNEASEHSFLNAMYTACEMFQMRTMYDESAKNQLKVK